MSNLPTQPHPEQKVGEIYLGNADPNIFFKTSWKTSRLGNQPLKLDGTPYTGGGLKPWFIQSSEVQDRLNTEKKTPLHNYAISVFEEMLAEYAVQQQNR